MTDLQFSGLGTLVPEATYYMCYATGDQVYCRSYTDGMAFMAFTSTLTWHHTHKQIHTQHIKGPTDWNINIH